MSKYYNVNTVKKEINKNAFHNFIGFFSLFLMTFIDAFFLSLKSDQDYAISIMSAPVLLFILSIFIGISNGLVVYLSKNYSKKYFERFKIANGLTVIVLITSILVCFFTYLNTYLVFDLLNIKEELYQESYNAIRWFYLGIPICVYLNITGGKFKGFGNAKIQSTIMMSTAFVNLLLDPIFIFYYDLGVEGATLSTFLSWLVIALIYIAFTFNNKRETYLFNLKGAIDVLKISPSFILSQIMNIVFGIVTLYFINNYAIDEITAFGFNIRLEKIVTIIALSYSTAFIMVGGNYLSNKDYVIDVFKISFKNSLILVCIYLGLLLLFSYNLSIIFYLSENAANKVSFCINVLAFGYFINVLTQHYSGYLYLFSKENKVFISNMVKIFILLPLFVYYGEAFFGYEGIIYGVLATFVLSFLFLVLLSLKEFKELIFNKELVFKKQILTY